MIRHPDGSAHPDTDEDARPCEWCAEAAQDALTD